MKRYKNTDYEHLRTLRFAPYRFDPGHKGPTFRLELYDTRRLCPGSNHWQLAYQFFQITKKTVELIPPTNVSTTKSSTELIFEGEDFGCSPCDAVDSDTCALSLMTFLTLRPGDTDAEYFDKYTPRQLQFANEHAEILALECDLRSRRNK